MKGEEKESQDPVKDWLAENITKYVVRPHVWAAEPIVRAYKKYTPDIIQKGVSTIANYNPVIQAYRQLMPASAKSLVEDYINNQSMLMTGKNTFRQHLTNKDYSFYWNDYVSKIINNMATPKYIEFMKRHPERYNVVQRGDTTEFSVPGNEYTSNYGKVKGKSLEYRLGTNPGNTEMTLGNFRVRATPDSVYATDKYDFNTNTKTPYNDKNTSDENTYSWLRRFANQYATPDSIDDKYKNHFKLQYKRTKANSNQSVKETQKKVKQKTWLDVVDGINNLIK